MRKATGISTTADSNVTKFAQFLSLEISQIVNANRSQLCSNSLPHLLGLLNKIRSKLVSISLILMRVLYVLRLDDSTG